MISNRYLKRPIIIDHHPVKTLNELQVNKASLLKKQLRWTNPVLEKNFSWMYFEIFWRFAGITTLEVPCKHGIFVISCPLDVFSFFYPPLMYLKQIDQSVWQLLLVSQNDCKQFLQHLPLVKTNLCLHFSTDVTCILEIKNSLKIILCVSKSNLVISGKINGHMHCYSEQS